MLKRYGGGRYETWLLEFGESERRERRTIKTRKNEGEEKQKKNVGRVLGKVKDRERKD